jgi:hypothetical protein
MSTLAEAVRRTLPPIVERIREGDFYYADYDSATDVLRQLEHLLDLADEEGKV